MNLVVCLRLLAYKASRKTTAVSNQLMGTAQKMAMHSRIKPFKRTFYRDYA